MDFVFHCLVPFQTALKTFGYWVSWTFVCICSVVWVELKNLVGHVEICLFSTSWNLHPYERYFLYNVYVNVCASSYRWILFHKQKTQWLCGSQFTEVAVNYSIVLVQELNRFGTSIVNLPCRNNTLHCMLIARKTS